MSANTFTGAAIDRAAHLRTDPEALAAAKRDPRAEAILLTADAVPVTADGAAATISLTAAVDVLGIDDEAVALLGVRPPDAGGAPVFAIDAYGLDAASLREALGPEARLIGLRDVAARLAPGDAGLLAYAQALITWHRANRFCARCGAPAAPREGGHLRRCTECAAHVHPRTDPVAIVVVVDGDRILLGRQPGWPEGRFSALAGFVEPGESLEEAVAREVAEEAGVAVAGVAYHSSQPWPFPGSLMVGFFATYAGGEPEPRDGELEAVRFFHRDEVRTATSDDGWTAAPRGSGGRLLLPPRVAVARRLVEAWLAA